MDSESDLKRDLGIHDSLWLGQVEIDLKKGELGIGSDAIVYRTVYDGRQVAVKVLHRTLISPRNVGRANFIRKFGEESKRLRQLSHPAIVSFIGVGQAPNGSPCLVLELMEDSLASRIAAIPPDTFLQTLSYLIDVAAGLRYLHWKEIIHRDLKPQNVLIVAGSAKISDVGLSRCRHGDGQQMLTRCPGTANFMAPESLDKGVEYGVALDIFAMGVTILTMFTNKAPAPKAREIQVLADGQRKVTSELERRVDDLENLDKDHPARPLIVRCLQDDPATRPSATELHQILLDIQQKYTGTDKFVLQSQLVAKEQEFVAFREAHDRDVASLLRSRGQVTTLQAETEAQRVQIEQQRVQIEQQRVQIEQQRVQIEQQRVQIEQQRVQIEQLIVSVQEQASTTHHLQQVCAPVVAAFPRVFLSPRQPPLPAGTIKKVTAKQKWKPLAGPPCIQGQLAPNPTKACVHLNDLYLAFNMSDRVHLYKYSTDQTWSEIPVPADIHNCMALVSGNTKLYMVFTKLPEEKTYAARWDDSSWTISAESPWEQRWPGVAFHAGSLHLVGGQTRDKTLITRSTSLTADLENWSSTELRVVDPDVIRSIFPAAPHAVSDPQLIVCQDTLYLVGGWVDNGCASMPVYWLCSSEPQLTWKRSTLPETPFGSGCASYRSWLWFVGGWNRSQTRHTTKVFCVQPSSNADVQLSSLPSPCVDMQVTVFDGKLMVIGGQCGKKWSSDILTLELVP